MYACFTIPDLIRSTEAAIAYPIEHSRTGVMVYVDADPDYVSPDFVIDPADEEGIKLFREFAARMAAHYKSLNQNP